jgi:hypothetical protein
MKPALLILTATVTALAISPLVTFGQDASCNRFIELTAAKPNKPYRATNTIAIDGATMKNEAIYIDGMLYSKSGGSKSGKWMVTKIPDFTETIAIAKRSTSKCVMAGSEKLDGVAMQVWTSLATTPFEPKPVQWKTWIGASDGLVYKQSSDGFEQRFSYDNVAPPPASEIAEPRKRK